MKTETDRSILEDRTKQRFAFLQCLLGTLAFRDVLRQGDEVLWLAYSVSEQLKPADASNDAPSRRMKRFFVLVGFSLTLDDSAYRFALEVR